MSRAASRACDPNGESKPQGEVDYYGQPIKKKMTEEDKLDELTRKNTLNNSVVNKIGLDG